MKKSCKPQKTSESSQREAVAAILVNQYHWNDCIQAQITLAAGDFPESFARKGLQVSLPGKIAMVSETVNQVQFLNRLGSVPLIKRELDTEVREHCAIGSVDNNDCG